MARLRKLQEKLYAQNNWGVLIFQALDAAGKGGAVEHVMSGVDPAGVEVCSFKAPSSEERSRLHVAELQALGPNAAASASSIARLRGGPDRAGAPRNPRGRADSEPARDEAHLEGALRGYPRFERYFARQGYVIRKFFLHITQKEQLKRLRKRLDEPEKNWKFNLGDLKERARWNDYMKAYED